jgi:hypothetical protein
MLDRREAYHRGEAIEEAPVSAVKPCASNMRLMVPWMTRRPWDWPDGRSDHPGAWSLIQSPRPDPAGIGNVPFCRILEHHLKRALVTPLSLDGVDRMDVRDCHLRITRSCIMESSHLEFS